MSASPFTPESDPMPQTPETPSQTGKPGPLASPAKDSIPNLQEVTPFLLRGGQPTQPGLLALKSRGVRTVVNLRNEEILVEREAKVCRRLGLKFVNIPLDVFNCPSDRAIKQFLQVIERADNRPVFVHCLHGQDRTGCLIAIYRIEKMGWSADQAYAEMLALGFRPGFSNLSSAVFARGRQAGRPGKNPTGAQIMYDLKTRLKHSVGN